MVEFSRGHVNTPFFPLLVFRSSCPAEPGALQQGPAGTPAAGEPVFTIYSERGCAKEWNFPLLSSFDATNRKWALTDAGLLSDDKNEVIYSPSHTGMCIGITRSISLQHRLRGGLP